MSSPKSKCQSAAKIFVFPPIISNWAWAALQEGVQIIFVRLCMQEEDFKTLKQPKHINGNPSLVSEQRQVRKKDLKVEGM